MGFKKIAVVLASLAILSCSRSQEKEPDPLPLTPKKQTPTMYFKSDFEKLDALNIGSDPKTVTQFKNTLGIGTSTTELKQFVDERVNYILPDMSNDDLIDRLSEAVYLKDPMRAAKEGMTLMANVGAAIYIVGQEKNLKIKIALTPSESVVVNTPRVGILMTGEAIDSEKILPNPKDKEALANSIYRLSVLFHEARHSDGSGPHTGFTHDKCPTDHDYADQTVCDKYVNGSYSVGSVVLQAMTSAACAEKCTQAETQKLLAILADVTARRIGNENADPTPVAPYKTPFEAPFKQY